MSVEICIVYSSTDLTVEIVEETLVMHASLNTRRKTKKVIIRHGMRFFTIGKTKLKPYKSFPLHVFYALKLVKDFGCITDKDGYYSLYQLCRKTEWRVLYGLQQSINYIILRILWNSFLM